MNVPMYLRDEEREMDRLMEEKEERWRREGLLGPQPGRQTALEIEARRQQQYGQLQTILQEKQDEALKQKIMQQQLHSAAMANQGSYILNHTSGGLIGQIYNGPPGQLGTSGLSGKIGQHKTPPPPDPNTMPEMQMSLEVAYNMWLVRFGDIWVKSEDVQDADGFRWPLVASRLRDMRLMEVTTVSNHYRLVPHVWT